MGLHHGRPAISRTIRFSNHNDLPLSRITKKPKHVTMCTFGTLELKSTGDDGIPADILLVIMPGSGAPGCSFHVRLHRIGTLYTGTCTSKVSVPINSVLMRPQFYFFTATGQLLNFIDVRWTLELICK